MPNATVNGVKLSYRQVLPENPDKAAGDVVLVHGLAANQAFWNLELVGTLAQQYRVTSFDLRGHGYSERTPSGYSPREMATDLRALLDHLSIDTAHLVGHSYGGLIALRLSIEAPQRVHSLTLADTRLRGIAPEQILPTQPDWPELQTRLARCGAPLDENEPEIGMQLLDAISQPRWAAARQRVAATGVFVPFAAQSGGENRSANRWRKLLDETTAREDFLSDGGITPAQVAGLPMPVLLAFGERSPHMASCRRFGELAPHSRTVVVAGGGHFHPASRAAAFAGHLGEFLGQIDRDRNNTPQTARGSKDTH